MHILRYLFVCEEYRNGSTSRMSGIIFLMNQCSCWWTNCFGSISPQTFLKLVSNRSSFSLHEPCLQESFSKCHESFWVYSGSCCSDTITLEAACSLHGATWWLFHLAVWGVDCAFILEFQENVVKDVLSYVTKFEKCIYIFHRSGVLALFYFSSNWSMAPRMYV